MSNEIIVPQDLSDVDKAIFLVRLSDKAQSLSRAFVHKIFGEKSWEGRFSSWGEFVEAGLNKSPSWASKQIAVHEYYHLKGGLSQDKLDFDNECLYLAIDLTGTPEEKVEKARVLSRSEIKEQKVFEKTGKEHDHSYICRICHQKAP